MKPRADKFFTAADSNGLKTVQEQAQLYKDDYPEDKMDEQQANNILLLYLQIAMDEGYRRAMEEMKADALTGSKINIVERRKGWFEYIEDADEVKKLVPLALKRIRSKRQRNAAMKLKEKQGLEFSEEAFTLSMVIHTGWEHGYMKANTLEHIAKITCGGDQERADLILDIFNKIFTKQKEGLDETKL